MGKYSQGERSTTALHSGKRRNIPVASKVHGIRTSGKEDEMNAKFPHEF
jgi:hypothetical protein